MSIFSQADVEVFKKDRVVNVLSNLAEDFEPSDAYLLGKLKAAESEVAHLLRTELEPTIVFPFEPTEADIDALAGARWKEEPGNDYDPGFFQGDRWGFIQLRTVPVISVASISFVYPAPYQAFYTIPQDWIRTDKRSGQIRLVPASAAWTAPLNAFLMQAMGGGMTIPNMIQVKYTCGLKDVKNDYPDLVDVIMKKAVLKMLDDLYLPASGSISADGLSQSINFDPERYRTMIDTVLFGPKGSNGGLWTQIHGIGSGILGVVA